MKGQTWMSDTSNKKVRQIKQSFQLALTEQAKQPRINYYDFLLVAKKLSFRFEESTHLMALKNFFGKNKNLVLNKKLVDALCVRQESLNSKDDKMQGIFQYRIVKFNVPENDFAPIKEATNQDEEECIQDDISLDHQSVSDREDDSRRFQKVGSMISMDESSQQINEKMSIILSIKMEEMQKKVKLLINNEERPNIFTIFQDIEGEQFSYETLRKGILTLIHQMKDKVRISQDDIKTFFFVLDQNSTGFITRENLSRLRDEQMIADRMKNFYYSRINRDMVKNTLFKLGKMKNSSIEIYQLKNASILEFQKIEEQIVQPIKNNTKKRIPHFGPLKGAANWKKNDRLYASTDLKLTHPQSTSLSANKGYQIQREREKIQKILRNSKSEKKRQKSGETVASKLRSLFIHKVILPRQKMLEQQKMKYGGGRISEHQLSIKPLKDTR